MLFLFSKFTPPLLLALSISGRNSLATRYMLVKRVSPRVRRRLLCSRSRGENPKIHARRGEGCRWDVSTLNFSRRRARSDFYVTCYGLVAERLPPPRMYRSKKKNYFLLPSLGNLIAIYRLIRLHDCTRYTAQTGQLKYLVCVHAGNICGYCDTRGLDRIKRCDTWATPQP